MNEDNFTSILTAMAAAASARPKRRVRPVQKYGFSPESEDELDDDTDSQSEEEVGLSSSDDEHTLQLPPVPLVDDNGWRVVDAESDPGPPYLQYQNYEGWQLGVDTSNFHITDYISHFLPEDLFQLLCDCTNARALIDNPRWKEVRTEEMKRFVGMTLYMGLVKKPALRDYWATDIMMTTPFCLSKQSLSRNRYIEILRYIRFSDPRNVQQENKNTRLKDLLNLCHQIFATYLPAQNVSFDEALLLFKGRLQIKVFVRIKRARFGVKLFLLCDTDGYTRFCIPYVGDQTEIECQDEDRIKQYGLTKSEKVVISLLDKSGCLDSGRIVHIDNWYTSVRLVNYLFLRNTGVRGTIRMNRGVPRSLITTHLRKGQSSFVRKEECLVVKFSDKKEFCAISSVDRAGCVSKERVISGGNRIVIRKPNVVHMYNNNMAGVDMADQYLSPYNMARKSHVWFKKVGFNLIQRLILNAFLRYKKEKNARATFKDFTQSAILQLTGIESTPKRPGSVERRAGGDGAHERQLIMHVIQKIPATEKKRNPKKRCRLCYQTGTRKDSRFQCSHCPEKPGLCLDCFGRYHDSIL